MSRPHAPAGLAVLLLAALLPAQTPPGAAREHTPAGIEVTPDLAYDDAARDPKRNLLDLYRPATATRPSLVLFVHGGTWTTGDKDQHRWIGEALAQHGHAAAVLSYRLSPFAHHPAWSDDVASAWAFLWRHADELGFDRQRMYVMGHSAGGHLAALLALDPHYLADRGVPADSVRAVIGLSGVYDVRPRHPVLDAVFGRDGALRQQASPLVHASAAAPPFLLLTGERDLPGLDLGARMLAERLHMLAVPARVAVLPGEDHASYLFRFGGGRDVLSPQVFAFLRDVERGRLPAPATAASVRELPVAGVRGSLLVPDRVAAPVLVLAPDGHPAAGHGDTLLPFARQLAAQGVAVAVVDTDAGTDGPASLARAVQAVRAQTAALGCARAAPFVGGVGGGAILAIAVAQDRRWATPVQGTVALGLPATDAARSLPPLAQKDAPALLLVHGSADAGAASARAFTARLLQTGQPHLAVELTGAVLPRLDRAATAGELVAMVLGCMRRG